MLSDFPVYDEKYSFAAEEEDFAKIIEAIKAVRARRTEMNVPPSVKAKIFVETEYTELFSRCAVFFETLASASEVEVGRKYEIEDAVTAVTDCARLFIPMAELIDKDKEIARLEKEMTKVKKDIDFLSGKLNNQGFLAKAPEKLIEAEKTKLAKAEEKMLKIKKSMEALK